MFDVVAGLAISWICRKQFRSRVPWRTQIRNRQIEVASVERFTASRAKSGGSQQWCSTGGPEEALALETVQIV